MDTGTSSGLDVEMFEMMKLLCSFLALGVVGGTSLAHSTLARAVEPVWLTEESLDQIHAGGPVVRSWRVQNEFFDNWFDALFDSDTWFNDPDTRTKPKKKGKTSTHISVSVNGKVFMKDCSSGCSLVIRDGTLIRSPGG